MTFFKSNKRSFFMLGVSLGFLEILYIKRSRKPFSGFFCPFFVNFPYFESISFQEIPTGKLSSCDYRQLPSYATGFRQK